MKKLKMTQTKLGNDFSMKFPKVHKVVFCDVSFRFAKKGTSKYHTNNLRLLKKLTSNS